jgi:hypothetical protein
MSQASGATHNENNWEGQVTNPEKHQYRQELGLKWHSPLDERRPQTEVRSQPVQRHILHPVRILQSIDKRIVVNAVKSGRQIKSNQHR